MSSFSPGGFMGIFFSIIPVMVILVFVLVFGTIIVSLVRSGKQHSQNKSSPLLSVEATVVTKRADVRHYRHHNVGHVNHMRSATAYYATFQVESGDRVELSVPDTEYGLLVEGDHGKLSFQGTWFKGFTIQ